jgi:hypothetical protein
MRNRIIYLANNEKNIIHLLEYVFLSKGDYEVKSFTTSEELCKNLSNNPDIIVLGESFAKSKTIDKLNLYNNKLPIIVLSNIKNSENMDLFRGGNYKCIYQTGFFVDKIVESVEIALQ